MKRRIVIWGDDHHNALGLLRMLGGHDFEILFLVHRVRREIATASKYCEKYVIVSSIDEGLEYLYRHYNDKNNKAVLLFTADKFSEAANENLEKLKDYFFVAGPSKESSLEQIDDKFYMGELAKKCGINVPDTVLLPPFDESIVKSYPVVIKPCSPKNKDFKVKIVKNKVAPPFRRAEFAIMFGEGISRSGEIIDLGAEYGVIKKSGSWYSYNDTKLGQGRDASKQVIQDNPELAEEIENLIFQAMKEKEK